MRLALSLALVVAQVVAQYPEEFPTAVLTVGVSADTDFNLHQVAFTISISHDGSGTPICGYDVHLGLSDTDMTGPLVLSVDTDSITDEAVTAFTRRYESAPGALYTLDTTDADGDGNHEQTLTYAGPNPITDASPTDTYFVNVFPRNCATPPATNPTPTSETITDIYLPYYAPLVASPQDDVHSNFDFEDTNAVSNEYDGSLVIYTDPSEEAKFGVTGYVVFATSTCTALPGCAATSPTDGVAFTLTAPGEWSAALSGFEKLGADNFVFIASTNPEGMGRERQIKLVDLREAISPNLDLLAATPPLIASLTPEKLIHNTNELDLNVADSLSLAIDVSDLETAAAGVTGSSIAFTWQVDPSGAGFRDITGAPNADQYDVGLVLGSDQAGTYRVQVVWSDLASATAPFYTQTFTSDELVVTVDTAPQRPETGVPINIAFTDEDVSAGFISGTLSFSESENATYQADSRQFEFYLVHLGSRAGCSMPDYSPDAPDANTLFGSCGTLLGRDGAGDTRLGVVRYGAGAQTFTIPRTAVSGTQYIHVTAYEVAGDGAESALTLSLEVADVQQEAAAPVPRVGAGVGPEFVDKEGASRVIGGQIFFQLDDSVDYSSVEKFEVYQYNAATFDDINDVLAYNDGSPIASFLMPTGTPGVQWTSDTSFAMFLGTLNNEFGSEADDLGTTFPLDYAGADTSRTGTHLDYLLIISRTGSNIVNGDEIGFVPSTTAAATLVHDRVDAYYFLDLLAEYTGTCPHTFCPSGTGDDSTRYWPHAEPAAEVDGAAAIYWVTASLTNLVLEVEGAGRAADLLDGTAVDDLSAVFDYSVALGSDATAPQCQFQDDPATYPHGAIDEWLEQDDLTQRHLFYTVADYAQLLACGFSSSGSGLDLAGVVSLYVTTDNGRSDATGSNVASNAPQMVIQADLTVSFDDETHASVANVAVENVVVVDAITAEVDVTSAIQLYEDAFLGTLDVTTTLFRSREDTFNVEHFLNSNEDAFHMQLERMWFSPGSSLTDAIELLVPPTSSAFVNVDDPALPGRYRFTMPVPILMNCKPCFMHLVSHLSTASRKKAITSSTAPKTARPQSVPVYVDVAHVLADKEDAASCMHASLVGAATALVWSRL